MSYVKLGQDVSIAICLSGSVAVAYAIANYVNPNLGLVLLAAVAAISIGVLIPFRVITIFLVMSSVVTFWTIDIGDVGLRPDILLLPSTLVSGVFWGFGGSLQRWASHPVVVLLALWIALQVVVSFSSSEDPSASLRIVVWFACNLLIVICALSAFGGERERLEQLLILAAVFAAVSGLLAWVQAAFIGHDSWGTASEVGVGSRAQGVSFEPNILAATCAFWALVILTRRKISKRAKWSLIPLLLVIPLTSTRAAIVALVFGLLIFVAGDSRYFARTLRVGLGAGLALSVAYLVRPSSFAGTLAKLGKLGFADQNSTFRYSSWRLALSDLDGVADWGLGLGTNSFQQRHIDPTLVASGQSYYLGNLPLQILYDGGIVAVMLVLMIAVMLIMSGNRLRRLSLMSCFVIISIATSPFFFSNWWLLIAVALAVPENVRPAVESHRNASRLTRSVG